MADLSLERPQEDISHRYFPDAELLVDRLIQILTAALPGSDGKSSADSAWLSYDALVEATLHSRVVWEAFSTRQDFVELHRTLLLTTTSNDWRARAAASVLSVCDGHLPSTAPVPLSAYRATFWPTITQILPDTIKYRSQSADLFRVAENIFHGWTADKDAYDEAGLRLCFSSWSNLLLEYQHEVFVGRDEVDYVVLGFTKLLQFCVWAIKSYKKKLDAGAVMEGLFCKYLFPPRVMDIKDEPTGRQLPVLEGRTRGQLYDLLVSLADDRATSETLLKAAQCLASYDDSHMLHVDPLNELRSDTGYVGLFNPRALCYMNSLLTQLFMNVNFRGFILGLSVASDGSQALLSEMQKLFAEMQNSVRKSADPRGVAACIKTSDGEPIDVTVQMDADEFSNMLFDQLEENMPSDMAKQEFRSFFGGKMTTQIKSKDCDHISERVENFFAIQCDVLGKRNLEESLAGSVEGDVMEGDNQYRCSGCSENLVDAVKRYAPRAVQVYDADSENRTCLKEVPDNLLIQLKRFDFDLETFNRRKINDHFEFPMEIDMSTYHIDHLSDPAAPKQSDLFELVGILVHAGTTDSGHYYSYVRERPCEPENSSQWVEFNDRDVSAFTPERIPDQAFGGEYEPGQQKNFSAYMLFYQRKAAMARDHRDFIASGRGRPAKVPLPSPLESSVSASNQTYLRQYCLHEPDYTKFLSTLVSRARNLGDGVCAEDHGLEQQALRALLGHAFLTLSRPLSLKSLEDILDYCRRLISCSKCCEYAIRWLIEDQLALESLLLAPHAKCRVLGRGFLLDALQDLREDDPVAYGVDLGEDVEPGTELFTRGLFVDVIRKFHQLWKQSLSKWPRAFDDFFIALSEIAHKGRSEVDAFLNEGFLADTLAMYLHRTQMQVSNEYQRLFDVLDYPKKNLLDKATEFLCILLSYTDMRLPFLEDTATYAERLAYRDDKDGLVPLTYTEYRFLTCLDPTNNVLAVVDRMLDSGTSGKLDLSAPSKMVAWLVEHDAPSRFFHSYIAKTVLAALKTRDPSYLPPYMGVVLPYCKASRDKHATRAVLEALVPWAQTLELGSACQRAILVVFEGLAFASNKCGEKPHWFQLLLLGTARYWANSMLQSDEEAVRHGTAEFLASLFRYEPEEADLRDDIYTARFESIRATLPGIYDTIVKEYHARTNRDWVDPLLRICDEMVHIVHALSQSDDPDVQGYKDDARDHRLIRRYTEVVGPRMQAWVDDVAAGTLSDDGEFAPRSGSVSFVSMANVPPEVLDPSEYSDDSDDDILETDE